MSARLVHITFPDPASAQALARSLVDARHELPELVAVEIADGLAPYLAWLHAETRSLA
jgi:uncharacterized protein involved in tolerance to divalent cations